MRLTLWVRDRWLGLWWWLLQPMAMCATYVFMVRYAFPGHARPFHALFIMCALLPWTCFIAATNQAVRSFVGNKNLLKSFRFNYLAMPLSEVMAATVRFVCSSDRVGRVDVVLQRNADSTFVVDSVVSGGSIYFYAGR